MTRASFFTVATGSRRACEFADGSARSLTRPALQIGQSHRFEPGTETVRDWTGASALRWVAGSAIPDRQRLDHRRQLRSLALLRVATPAPCGLRGVVLSLHGQQQL